MGWWSTNKKGQSFTEDGSGYHWGDGPADTLDDAIDNIRAQFREAFEREPFLGELRAGLEFSLMGEDDDMPANELHDG